jgi:chromosome partitioning protein
MTRRIAVGLSKGGVGKTTTAVNLAHGLSRIGKKVLLIDTDTQGQSSKALGINPKYSLAELLNGEVKADEVVELARPNLWLVAGGRSLAGLKRFLDRKELGAENSLLETMETLETKFDFVILDTAPSWDVLNVNGLIYAREILMPVSLEALTLTALADYQESVKAVSKYNKDLELKYVLPTFFDKRVKKSLEFMEQLSNAFNGKVCDPIRYNVKLSEAPAFGRTIFEHDSHSHGSIDYAKLVKRVIAV